MPRKHKRSRLWLAVEILALLLVVGTIAYAWREAEADLDMAEAEITRLEATSAQDSALLAQFRGDFGHQTDSMQILEIRVEGLGADLERCLAAPSDTFYTPAPPPDTVTVPGPAPPPDTIPGPTVYLPGDTVWMPGEITVREVKTGRGYPHWSDFLQIGVAVAACLILENTGGSETVTFRDNGEI